MELGTTQPPIQWIQADLFLGLNLSVHENHTPPCSAEFKTVNLLSPTYACYVVWCVYLSYVTCFLACGFVRSHVEVLPSRSSQ
jgi:hypothetical protein